MAETTLRDTIESAIEQHVEPDTGITRDESGKFAKAEPTPKAEPEAKVAEPPVVEPPIKTVPRPSSWKKDYEQDWDTLPERIREYINEREGQYAKGVSTYKSQWDQAQPLYEAIQPFMPELQKYNIQPSQWIANLGNAHRTLALGTPEQKVQMFARLANEYGVPLQAITGQGQPDPQFSILAQELNNLKNEWQTTKAQTEMTETAIMQAQIEEFKAHAPHFEAVRETMAKFLQNGMAEDLPGAYEKAIRYHDDVWREVQAQQAKEAEAARQAEIQAKKAKAVSPRSGSPTGQTNASGGKKSLRDQLSESVAAVMGGQI
jgi:hypothetical protein